MVYWLPVIYCSSNVIQNKDPTEAATRGVKKGVLINFAKFTGKHLCQRLFFNKVYSGTGVFL